MKQEGAYFHTITFLNSFHSVYPKPLILSVFPTQYLLILKIPFIEKKSKTTYD